MIRNEGALALAQGEAFTVLLDLYLSGTKIGDEGACSIAEALAKPACSLQTLSLSGCNIHDKGGQALSSKLSTLNLKALDLQGNYFSEKVLEELAKTGRQSSAYVVIQGVDGKAILNS